MLKIVLCASLRLSALASKKSPDNNSPFDDEEKIMSAKDRAHLAQVKLALAEKYERLERDASSIPRKKTYRLRAARYRRDSVRLTLPE
jgi:hypothetical protein